MPMLSVPTVNGQAWKFTNYDTGWMYEVTYLPGSEKVYLYYRDPHGASAWQLGHSRWLRGSTPSRVANDMYEDITFRF